MFEYHVHCNFEYKNQSSQSQPIREEALIGYFVTSTFYVHCTHIYVRIYTYEHLIRTHVPLISEFSI